MDKLFNIIDEIKDSIDDVKEVVDIVTEAAEYAPEIIEAVTDTVDVVKGVGSDVIEKLEDHAISMGATPTENMKEDSVPNTTDIKPTAPKSKRELASPITPKKEYFSDDELKCKHCGALVFDADFRKKLNVARELAGNPWVVTSGYRCAEHNLSVGGVKDSAHLTGQAVDIYAPTSEKKFEIIVKAIVAGITRIGISNEFVHLDDDQTKQQNVVFLY